MKQYDVILIGTGQATGTCVNWGCTPMKTLVAGARAAHMVGRAGDFGIILSLSAGATWGSSSARLSAGSAAG